MPIIDEVVLKDVDTALLFNNPLFSDVTIIFQRDVIPCHRFVLNAGSSMIKDYALERGQSYDIENNVTYWDRVGGAEHFRCAVYFALRWIYTYSYMASVHMGLQYCAWEVHFGILLLAHHFQLPALRQQALSALEGGISDVGKAVEMYVKLSDIINLWGDHGDEEDSDFRMLLEVLEREYFLALTQSSYFMSGKDKDDKAGMVDELARTLSILRRGDKDSSQAVKDAHRLARRELGQESQARSVKQRMYFAKREEKSAKSRAATVQKTQKPPPAQKRKRV